MTRPPGYLLRLNPEAIDAVRFERLVRQGRQALEAERPAVASERLTAALALWRGDAYAEFLSTPVLRAEAAKLEQVRLAAVAERVEVGLAAGMGGELAAELDELTRQHPGNERLWGQLMRALYRAERQSDALATFRRAREVLSEESGVDPSPQLAEIHRQILVQDDRLLAPLAAPAARRAPGRTFHSVWKTAPPATAARSPAGGCWCCWTTPPPSIRSGRYCRARRRPRSWSPAGTGWPAWATYPRLPPGRPRVRFLP